jgi:hypothetical protein
MGVCPFFNYNGIEWPVTIGQRGLVKQNLPIKGRTTEAENKEAGEDVRKPSHNLRVFLHTLLQRHNYI